MAESIVLPQDGKVFPQRLPRRMKNCDLIMAKLLEEGETTFRVGLAAGTRQ
jgi:hypothetical protein